MMLPLKLQVLVFMVVVIWIHPRNIVYALQPKISQIIRSKIDPDVSLLNGKESYCHSSKTKKQGLSICRDFHSRSSSLAASNHKSKAPVHLNSDTNSRFSGRVVQYVLLPMLCIFSVVKVVLKSAIPKEINSFFVKHPYVAAFLVCSLKAASADYIVQRSSLKKQEGKDDNQNGIKFERRRNIAFFFYGGAYQGCIQEFIFNHSYPLLFGAGTDPSTVLKIVLFDMFITSPILCIPFAYVLKGAIYNNTFMHSIKSYIHDVTVNGVLTKNWMIWGPAQFVTFSVIPVQYRITFVAIISFFWLLLFSSIAGKQKELT